LIWRIKLKTIKTLTKKPWKTIRNQKKIDQIEIIIIFIEKTKNHKLDLKGKIESSKIFDKMTKEKREREIQSRITEMKHIVYTN
jgi:hypothetical protein